ncbi:cytotoxin [Salinivibrio proteolyticus]|uniref:Cytotoxin n=1 Tax=Salinivibrio proteolyticus TaxID=334715 RepID=A0ABY7LI43_9GAMM|nr:cytotoxin [Salinivibrio proteolyticus]WBA16302.1 cytotoxin [Salinivibrio proteolyticus]
MNLSDVFDSSKPHRCPVMHPDPLTCPCASCEMARQHAASKAALDGATASNFAPTGASMPVDKAASERVVPKETSREKIERQRRERFHEQEENWQKTQANEPRYAEHRNKIVTDRKAKEQNNRIYVGEEQKIPGAIVLPAPASVTEINDAVGKRVLPSDLLGASFANQPVSTGVVAHQVSSLSAATQKEVRESGELVFSGMQYQYAYGTVGSIQVIDTFAGEQPDKNTSQMAYWVAQGKYLDIPKHPDPHRDHLYVFTPNFSGCSFVVDDWDDDRIRVYHVEGGKEDKQYNELQDHGNNLIKYMSSCDYGFYQQGNTIIQNVHGFAFMSYNTQTRNWEIHYQKQEHAPSIIQPKTSAKSLFSSEKHTAKIIGPKESRVVETGTIVIKR